MIVIVLLVFVSLVLVAAAVLLFAYAVRNRDIDRAEQLALAPLEPESGAAVPPRPPA